MLAGIGRVGPHPGPDPLKPVGSRFELVRGSVQLATQELAEFGSLRRYAVVAGSRHYSCSVAARRALVPRALCVLTAPRPMPIAVAVSASDGSAYERS